MRARRARRPPSPAAGYLPTNQVDSFLRINPDNTVNLLTSQVEIGNGIPTGFLMIAAEELDMTMDQMTYGSTVKDKNGVIIGTVTDGWVAVNTGGHGGSNAIVERRPAGPRGRRDRAAGAAAASPRRRSACPGEPVGENGVVSGGGKTVTYGELVGGKLLNATIAPTSLQPGRRHPRSRSRTTSWSARAAPRIDIPARSPATTRTCTRSGCRACCTAAGCGRAARARG